MQIGLATLVVLLSALALCACTCSSPSPPSTEEAEQQPTGRPVASRPEKEVAPEDPCTQGLSALLQRLREPLRVDFYASRVTPKMKEWVETRLSTFRQLARASGGRFVLREFDTTSDEPSRAAARAAGLIERRMAGWWPDSTASVAQGFAGVVFSYRAEKAVAELIPTNPAGDGEWLAREIQTIRYKADGVSQRIGVVEGKGEIALSEPSLVVNEPKSIQSVVKIVLPFYEFVPVDLGSAVEEDLKGLLITQPSVDFTNDELRRIDDFVMRGRSLVVLSGAANLQPGDPTMHAVLSTHRIENILDGYGIELRNEVLVDDLGQSRNGWIQPGMFVMRSRQSASGVLPLLDPTFVVFFGVEELTVPFPSPLLPHPERQPSARVRVVARSPASAIGLSGPIDLRPTKTLSAKGSPSQHAIAIVVDGDIKSSFGPEHSKEARVLVIASPQFLANPFARALIGQAKRDEVLEHLANAHLLHYVTPTFHAFSNVLDWMSANDPLIAACAASHDAP